jgi:hypothetical protein
MEVSIEFKEPEKMKKTGFWVLVGLGLFLAIGGLAASKFSLIDFVLNPAGVLGIILLI